MPEVTGYLEKFSGSKDPNAPRRRMSMGLGTARWERRFFVLREGSHVLSIFKSPDDAATSTKPAQATISIQAASLKEDPQDMNGFAITQGEKTTYLRAGHAAARTAWLQAMCSAGAFFGETTGDGSVSRGDMSGTLLKQKTGGLMSSKWDKRFAALRDGQLMVFKSEADAANRKPPLSVMTLDGARLDIISRGGDGSLSFALSRGDKVQTLKAGSEEELARWRKALSSQGVIEAPGSERMSIGSSLASERASRSPRASRASRATTGGAGSSGVTKKAHKKRMGVSAEADDKSASVEEYVKRVYPKTEEASAFIMATVTESALFSGVSNEQRQDLVDAMQEILVSPGEMVIQQGDEGSDFFVVQSGEYSVLLKQVGEEPVHRYHSGGMFGELALLYNQPRAASIRCEVGGKLYALDRQTFRAVLRRGTESTLEKKVALLKRVRLLEGLRPEQLKALTSIMLEETYLDGQVVCEQDAQADSLYIVRDGLVHSVVTRQSSGGIFGGGAGTTSTELTPYQVGEHFGDAALQDPSARWPGNVSAVGAVALLRLKREDVYDLLGDLAALVRENFQKNVLGAIEMFHELSSSEMTLLIESLTERRYQPGEVILRQGDPGTNFYIVRSGEVKISKCTEESQVDTEIARLGEGTYFGELALLSDEPRMASVTAIAATVCMTVDRNTFSQVIGPMQQLLEREGRRRKEEAERLTLQPTFALADLRKVGMLGVGTFGRVWLVDHAPSGATYALKCMRKKQLIALKQVEHVHNEISILRACDHPFLINLAGTFQDRVEVYMVLELALGGELFSLLRDRIRFEESMARFYAANVVSAFVHLHDNKIAYRDLKPENLLLDSTGYIKICDFGFAKRVDKGRTFTLCGTPEYLAPEIISNVGHNTAVDWWAVGILLYEMLTGDPPFVHDDPMQLYQMILHGNFLFPSLVGKNAKDLINRLLVANPAARLGSLKRGTHDIKAHSFFKLIDITFLSSRLVKPPYVPTLSSDKDFSNFDDISEQEAAPQNPAWAHAVSDSEEALFNW